MLSRLQVSAICAVGVALAVYYREQTVVQGMDMPTPASAVETGAHWANPADFATIKKLGHQFAVVALDRDPDHWRQIFDEAEKVGLRLVAGLHPYPYHLSADGRWTIDPEGRQFIEFARERSVVLKAIYGFNEPYWVSPSTGLNNPCGVYSAAELRHLRITIRQLWPDALIYHDLGRPSLWAPGGSMERDHRCVGQRYAETSDVADYAGIWFNPFKAGQPYDREELVRSMREETAYVTRVMHAEPILLGQAFQCNRCVTPTRMPSLDELRDLNCTLRWMSPQGVSWYPWRQPAYEATVASRPELWPGLGPKACPEGRGR